MIRLGAFVLTSPIGRGGMGEVWGGEHLETGAPIAAKVLTEKRAGDRRFRRAFRNEARAVAGLDHPNIVDVYDFGEVPDAAARASNGRLALGASYLVMEYVGGGTLSQRRGRMSWVELKAVLLSLLDALAHAHARNVIHRDLKPANVLVGDGGARVKLTDFGLAHAVDREGVTHETGSEAIGGTPAYMAPEQFYGDSRDVGPWSDLYALGCLVFSMARGEPPFGRKPWLDVASAHLYRAVPPLSPRITVPDGFEDWVRRLLAKDVSDRYQRAADAAWDLDDLEDPTEELLRPMPLPAALSAEDTLARLTHGESAPESAVSRLISATQTTLVWNREQLRTAAAEPVTEPAMGRIPPSALRHEPPPLPFSWRRPDRANPPGRLLGLGLYAVRTVPLVDRELEREALWRALRQSRRRGRATAVVVQGGAGCGKSRLAEWLCQRAHELGAATILEAVHSSIATRHDGLGPMLLRYLRCAGLPREDTIDRIEKRLARIGIEDPETVGAVTELVAPATDAERATGVRQLRFHGTTERHALVRRVLHHAARERPLVLWIDDAQWGLDAVEFTQHVLEVQEYAPLPVLVVLTVREEALAPRSAEADALAAVLADPHAERLSLGPLPAPDHRALIRELLGLAPELAARVEARTAGNPQFAVRLVGDWVQRKLLVRSEDGFRLRDGADVHLPDDLHAVWSGTVAQLLDARAAPDGVALELAAVLGRDVTVSEWLQACAVAEATPSAGLLDALLARRLAHAVDPEQEWSFAHEMLRECLLRRARDGGRWQAHHQVCAEVVRATEGSAASERLARHLVEADRLEEAVAPMLVVARGYVEAGEYRAARVLLADREGLLERLAAPHDDLRWGEGWVVIARVSRLLHHDDEAERWSRQAMAAARGGGHEPLLLEALREHGLHRMATGDVESATPCIVEGLELARALADARSFAELTGDLGYIHMLRGDLARAQETFLEAITRYRAAGQESAAAPVWMGLCTLGRRHGSWELALQWAEQARRCYEIQGSRWGVALAIHNRSDVMRLAGDLEGAERGFREALTRLEELGLERNGLARVNLALVLATRGQHAEARGLLQRWLADNPTNRSDLLAPVQAALAACAAGLREWQDLDRHLEQVELHTSPASSQPSAGAVCDPDLGEQLERAGELARRAGHRARARRALTLATLQWRLLGRRGDEDRVRHTLQGLPG